MNGDKGSFRVATWNVERPKPRSWKIGPAQRRRMAGVDADVWVLSETHVEHTPGPEFGGVFSPSFPERRPEPERWVGIWSRWPITALADPAPHRRGSLAAQVETPAGPVIVYGTVIPWANDPWLDDGNPAGHWEAHLAAIERQGEEWYRLRTRYPGLPLIVTGDFNQSRDGSNYYGSRQVVDRLTARLDDAGLRCHTEVDVNEAGLLLGRHLVDHICSSAELTPAGPVHCWGTHDGNVRLSDHPTVAVDFMQAESRYGISVPSGR